jgi:hypothetical protein
MKRWILLPLALMMLWPATALSQEEDWSPTWWVVFTEEVEPAMVADFEAASTEMIELVRANAPEGMVYYTLSGNETGYMYAIPMDSYEQLMELGAQWEGMVDAIGRDVWDELEAKTSKGVKNRSMSMYIERSDLSYAPENPRLTEEAPMRHYDWLYPIPGKEDELEGLLREWVEMYSSHEANSGFTTYQAFTGDRLPLYVLGTYANDRGDYEADGDRLDELMGDADDALMKKSWAVLRDFEHNDSWMRPDLSLMPEPEPEPEE